MGADPRTGCEPPRGALVVGRSAPAVRARQVSVASRSCHTALGAVRVRAVSPCAGSPQGVPQSLVRYWWWRSTSELASQSLPDLSLVPSSDAIPVSSGRRSRSAPLRGKRVRAALPVSGDRGLTPPRRVASCCPAAPMALSGSAIRPRARARPTSTDDRLRKGGRDACALARGLGPDRRWRARPTSGVVRRAGPGRRPGQLPG